MEEIIEKDRRWLKETKINEFTFGLRPNYKKIGLYASDEYAHKKYLQNPLAGEGNVDLIKTGAFVNSLFVFRKSRNGYLFDSSNTNKDNLIGKYGMDIMGLNKETFEERQKNIYRITLSYEIQKILNKI